MRGHAERLCVGVDTTTTTTATTQARADALCSARAAADDAAADRAKRDSTESVDSLYEQPPTRRTTTIASPERSLKSVRHRTARSTSERVPGDDSDDDDKLLHLRRQQHSADAALRTARPELSSSAAFLPRLNGAGAGHTRVSRRATSS